MQNPLLSYQAVCRPGTGAGAFFASILVWGVGIGCFGAVFNNFLVETYDINGFDRGVLEFLRETPGVLLVALFAVLGRFSDWKVLRIGTVCSLVAAMLLLVPVRWAWAVAFIVMWALGEHLVMPVRQSIALSIAKEGKSGESLGIVTGAIMVSSLVSPDGAAMKNSRAITPRFKEPCRFAMPTNPLYPSFPTSRSIGRRQFAHFSRS